MASDARYINIDSEISNEELPKYVCIGHGLEEIAEEKETFEDRAILPEGYCVVTYVEAGDVATNKQVCPIFDLFRNTDDDINNVLSNPELFRDIMPEGMRVYYPGMKVPKLIFIPNTTWSKSRTVCKSGVFKYPISDDIIFPISKSTETDIDDETYKGYLKECNNGMCKLTDKTDDDTMKTHVNIFPETWKGTEIYETIFKGDIELTLEKIMRKLGKGFYYFPICRGCKEKCGFCDDPTFIRKPLSKSDERLVTIRRKSLTQHELEKPTEIPKKWPLTRLEMVRKNAKAKRLERVAAAKAKRLAAKAKRLAKTKGGKKKIKKQRKTRKTFKNPKQTRKRKRKRRTTKK